mgnify:CR=1 FL=1
MNPIVYHIASGGSFFTGVVLICLAIVLIRMEQRVVRRLGVFLLLLGLFSVSVASTPLPYWLLGLLLSVAFVWLISHVREKWRPWMTIAVVLACSGAAVWEAGYWVIPRPHRVELRAVTIIGDSVTAGIGVPDEVTWPTLLAQQQSLAVQDLSGSGFTTAQALSRVKSAEVRSPLVIVEIGGNDLLAGVPAEQFRRDLDDLLTLLKQDGRQVVMLELPLIPFHGNYGRAQRSLARKHGVLLVPKRIFLDILAPQDNTVDTIHLSPTGHQQMADTIWKIIGPAYEGD